MVYAQPESDLEDGIENFQVFLRYRQITKYLPEDLVIINKKKRTCQILEFIMQEDDRVKIRKRRRDKYLDLARDLKKIWKMKVTVIPIIIGAPGTVLKIFEEL